MNHAPTYRELEDIVSSISIAQEHLYEATKALEGINDKMSFDEIKKAVLLSLDEQRTVYSWIQKAKGHVKDLGENDPIEWGEKDRDEY